MYRYTIKREEYDIYIALVIFYQMF